MFDFFKKAEVDKEKVVGFVKWFCENEERIRLSVENRMIDNDTTMQVLNEVEANLAYVYFDGYRREIEFNYGGKDQEWELNLFHSNNKFLKEATKMIETEFNKANLPYWTITIDR